MAQFFRILSLPSTKSEKSSKSEKFSQSNSSNNCCENISPTSEGTFELEQIL